VEPTSRAAGVDLVRSATRQRAQVLTIVLQESSKDFILCDTHEGGKGKVGSRAHVRHSDRPLGPLQRVFIRKSFASAHSRPVECAISDMRVTVMFDAGKYGVMTHKIVCPSPTYADMAPRVVANSVLRWRAMFAARVEALAACLSERDRA
jgi:hypothetical protein